MVPPPPSGSVLTQLVLRGSITNPGIRRETYSINKYGEVGPNIFLYIYSFSMTPPCHHHYDCAQIFWEKCGVIFYLS